MTTTAPKHLVLRAYQVGFGDCFLLRFEYTRGRARHVLVDFGSTKGGADPVKIANDIATGRWPSIGPNRGPLPPSRRGSSPCRKSPPLPAPTAGVSA